MSRQHMFEQNEPFGKRSLFEWSSSASFIMHAGEVGTRLLLEGEDETGRMLVSKALKRSPRVNCPLSMQLSGLLCRSKCKSILVVGFEVEHRLFHDAVRIAEALLIIGFHAVLMLLSRSAD